MQNPLDPVVVIKVDSLCTIKTILSLRIDYSSGAMNGANCQSFIFPLLKRKLIQAPKHQHCTPLIYAVFEKILKNSYGLICIPCKEMRELSFHAFPHSLTNAIS